MQKRITKEIIAALAKTPYASTDGTPKDEKKVINEGIRRMEEFFRSIGMPVSLSELNAGVSESDLEQLSLDATLNDTLRLTRIRPLDAEAVKKIYRRALSF